MCFTFNSVKSSLENTQIKKTDMTLSIRPHVTTKIEIEKKKRKQEIPPPAPNKNTPNFIDSELAKIQHLLTTYFALTKLNRCEM